jgi:WD40 repeat protein
VSLAFGGHGRLLAAAGWTPAADESDGTLAVWSLEGPAPARLMAVREHVDRDSFLAFSPDGRTLALNALSDGPEPAAGSGTASGSLLSGSAVLDLAPDGRLRLRSHFAGGGGQAAFSPDGRLLAMGTMKHLRLLSLDRSHEYVPVALWNTAGSDGPLAFSQDSHILAAASFGHLGLWDVTSTRRPRALRTLSQDTDVEAMAFSPDAATVLTMGNDRVTQWFQDGSRGPRLLSTVRTGDRVLTTSAAVEARKLALADGRDVRLWSLADPRRPVRLAGLPAASRPVTSVALSPDGQLLAVGHDLLRDDLPEGRERTTIDLWDVSAPARPRLRTTIDVDGPVTSVEFAPDGRTLTAVGEEQFAGIPWLLLRDTAGNRQRTVHITDFDSEGTVGFVPGSDLLTVGTVRRGERLTYVDAKKGTVSERTTPSLDPGQRFAYAPDGRFFAGFTDNRKVGYGNLGTGELGLWRVDRSGRPARLVATLGPEGGHVVGFSPAAPLLLVGAADGYGAVVDVGDPRTPRIAQRFEPASTGETDNDDGYNAEPAFLADGRQVVTVTGSGVLSVWDLGGIPALAGDLLGWACRTAGGGLTARQWKTYAPGAAHRRDCA